MEKERKMFSMGRTLIYTVFIFSLNTRLKSTFHEPGVSDTGVRTQSCHQVAWHTWQEEEIDWGGKKPTALDEMGPSSEPRI